MFVSIQCRWEPPWNSVNGVVVRCAPSMLTTSALSVGSVIVAVMEGSADVKKAEVNYVIVRGEIWERLVILKDRRTHRKRVPTEVAATIKVGDTLYQIPAEVTSEGGVLLSLNANNTEWLADGEYFWDMVATVSRSALLTSTPLTESLVVRGTLTVITYDNLTPMESDGVTEALAVVA